MAWNYNPADGEGNGGGDFEPLAPGTYDSMLEAVEEQTSKQGTQMYKVTYAVYAGQAERKVWDYIPHTEKMVWKLKRIAEAFGVVDDFNTGQFDPSCYVGCGLRLKLAIDPAKGDYSAKNVVRGWEPKPGASIVKRASTLGVEPVGVAGSTNDPKRHVPVSEDDIPF